MIPAIDLRGGCCVQLVGGDLRKERLRIKTPVSVARLWARHGFSELHLVDLDAAFGRGRNTRVARNILGERTARVQIGGGIRDEQTVAAWLEAGAASVIMGTRALDDGLWLSAVARAYPERVIAALDLKGRQPVMDGWRRGAAVTLEAALDRFDALPLRGILLTAVHREGRLTGADIPLVKELSGRTKHPIMAAGGVSAIDDLRALAGAGAAAAIVGTALYTGHLNPQQVVEEFVC